MRNFCIKDDMCGRCKGENRNELLVISSRLKPVAFSACCKEHTPVEWPDGAVLVSDFACNFIEALLTRRTFAMYEALQADPIPGTVYVAKPKICPESLAVRVNWNRQLVQLFTSL